jgi:hypothetical protein
MEYIETLEETILKLHGCKAEYVGTVPVTETFQRKTVWEGDVEVFRILGHEQAKRCYAWSHETESGKCYLAVLEIPPIDSPQTAVQAAIVNEFKSKQKPEGG